MRFHCIAFMNQIFRCEKCSLLNNHWLIWETIWRKFRCTKKKVCHMKWCWRFKYVGWLLCCCNSSQMSLCFPLLLRIVISLFFFIISGSLIYFLTIEFSIWNCQKRKLPSFCYQDQYSVILQVILNMISCGCWTVLLLLYAHFLFS